VIRHAPRGNLNQPGARIIGDAFPWPLNGGRQQRFLHGVFGVREVPETADDRAKYLWREITQLMLETAVQ
jgi:hypothetical protein